MSHNIAFGCTREVIRGYNSVDFKDFCIFDTYEINSLRISTATPMTAKGLLSQLVLFMEAQLLRVEITRTMKTYKVLLMHKVRLRSNQYA